MSDIVATASFVSGEWAPSLFARVDIEKYRRAAAKLENFFVDYRGGASTRPGTAYVNRAFISSKPVRLVRFQASFETGYVLEFGEFYVRFYFQGKPVLENGFAISGATQANPCVITVLGHNFTPGPVGSTVQQDWIFVSGVVGMTQLNGLFYRVLGVSGDNITLGNLDGTNLDSTGFSAYISGGTAQRDYTIFSPYGAADLAKLKFSVTTNLMILTHPDHVVRSLIINGATDWSFKRVVIGASIDAPAISNVTSTLGAGDTNFSYKVTSIDNEGQESQASSRFDLNSKQDFSQALGTNTITWTFVQGAVAYNVYKSTKTYFAAVPGGQQYGFIGTSTGLTFADSNIGPNFSFTSPLAQRPFTAQGVRAVSVTVLGSYTTVPTVSFSGSPNVSAIAFATLVSKQPTIHTGGTNYAAGDAVTFETSGPGENSRPLTVKVATVNIGDGSVATLQVFSAGGTSGPVTISENPVPANPLTNIISTTGSGTGLQINVSWGVMSVTVTQTGHGYGAVPTVTFTPAGASATAFLGLSATASPTVSGFYHQRLVLAASLTRPSTLWFSQPGNYTNFDTHLPILASDAIVNTLVSSELNSIKSFVQTQAGLLVLTDKAPWMIDGGARGTSIGPISITANPQNQVGTNDMPPIVANYDILYVQAKGVGVRDLAFNIHFDTFTGSDISFMASHLFYGFELLEWAWAEAPFYVVWAVRDDGQMLSLTFMKEQELVGWAHHKTVGGDFRSVAVVSEATATFPHADATYAVVERVVNAQTVKYIERFSERIIPNVDPSGWFVDAGISYSGAPSTVFSGAKHLAGLTVTGVADGDVIPPFVMPLSGIFTLAEAASTVIVGIGFTADLQTMALEVGEPSVQGKVKKIPHVDVRVNQTLGLKIGPDFNHLQPMKDLIVGNVGSMLTGQESQVVSGLYSGDARTYLGSAYTVPGQYAIRQDQPLPATVLGVFPAVVQGDIG